MPPPPDVSLLTRYVFENPWPLGMGLMLVAAWAMWTGLRQGIKRRQQTAGVLALISIAVFSAAFLVQTSGEHAKAVVRGLVAAVVDGDPSADGFFASRAVIAFGSPKNPGHGLEMIEQGLARVASQYPIESNSTTMLRGYTQSGDVGIVHLACWTTVRGGYGPTPSQWVLRVERQLDQSWLITHITCVSINNQTPSSDRIW